MAVMICLASWELTTMNLSRPCMQHRDYRVNGWKERSISQSPFYSLVLYIDRWIPDIWWKPEPTRSKNRVRDVFGCDIVRRGSVILCHWWEGRRSWRTSRRVSWKPRILTSRARSCFSSKCRAGPGVRVVWARWGVDGPRARKGFVLSLSKIGTFTRQGRSDFILLILYVDYFEFFMEVRVKQYS